MRKGLKEKRKKKREKRKDKDEYNMLRVGYRWGWNICNSDTPHLKYVYLLFTAEKMDSGGQR